MSFLTERNLFLAPLQHQLSNFFLDDWSSTDMYFCTFAQRLWLKCANVCAYSFLAWTPSIFFHSNDHQPSEHIVVQMLCNCLNVQSCGICTKVHKCKSAKVQLLSKHCTNFHTALYCVWREVWLCRDFPHSLSSSRYHPVTQWISKPMSHCTCISISTGEDRLPLLGLQSKYDSRSLWNPIPTIKWPVGWVLRYYHRDSRSQIHLGAIVPCQNYCT